MKTLLNVDERSLIKLNEERVLSEVSEEDEKCRAFFSLSSEKK
ncbi:hypothetical protein [Pseudodesulfovibrio piezophilus]|nr:hypothetical protein [Pseudodesulfovibrio piezophilus]